MMRMYEDKTLPGHWIVGDLSGDMQMVPWSANGWKFRQPYQVPPGAFRNARLDEVPLAKYAAEVGIPGFERQTVESRAG